MHEEEECMERLALVITLFMAKLGIDKISFNKDDLEKMDALFFGKSLVVEGTGTTVEVSMVENAGQYVEQVAEGLQNIQ